MANINGLNPYLFFDGRCEEAIEFYRKTLGAEVLMLMRYKEAPPEAKAQQEDAEKVANRIMHARLGVGGSTILMSDGPCSGKYDGFAMILSAAAPAEAERLFAALGSGGNIDMPMSKTFFSPAFGMLTDRFGIKWMVIVEAAR